MSGSEQNWGALQKAIRRLTPGGLAKNTLVVMCWQFVRLAALAAWLFFVARWLGPNEYGQLMGVAGLATTMAGLVGVGIGLLMYQSVAVDPQQFSLRWRQTLFSYASSGGVFLLAFFPLASLMFDGVDRMVVAALGVSEVLAFPFVGAAAFALAAHERMGWAAALPAASAILRAGLAWIYFAFAASPSIDGYVLFHMGSSIVAAALSVLSVYILLKPHHEKTRFSQRDIRQGLGYSGVWFSGNALVSWDKALALRIGGAELAGLYAISYRVAAVLAVPVDSLVMAVMPRLFRQGSGSIQNPRLVFWLCMAIGIYGSAVGLCLFFAAGHIASLLGEEFAPAAYALRWFGLFVPLYGFRLLGAQILMAQHRKRLRLVAEMTALVVMTVLSLWLIPLMGLQGAALTVILVEAGLSAAMWIMAIRPIAARCS